MADCEDCGEELEKICIVPRPPMKIESRTADTVVFMDSTGQIDMHKAVCQSCALAYEADL